MPGQPNKNWPRWIFASVSKHFEAKRDGIYIFVEGQIRDTKELDSWIEIRVDGPYTQQHGSNDFRLNIEINVLCVAKCDDKDFHRIHRITGIVGAAFTSEIFIFKNGDTVEDDQSLIGCLVRRDDKKEAIVTSNFGLIDPDVPIMQATVEGHYTAHLAGE